MVTRQIDVLKRVQVPVRWMSIEPLSFDISPLLSQSNLQWAVIGAATNGSKTYQPKPEWVESAIAVLKQQETAIFFKGNLEWEDWLEEFPSQAVSITAS